MTMQHPLNGTWHNEYGSDMHIEVQESGLVRGKFRTAVGRSETKTMWHDTWFDVVGFVNGDLFSFVVNFDVPEAMITSSGRLIKDKDNEIAIIDTISYTRYNVPEDQIFRAVAANSASYKRAEKP